MVGEDVAGLVHNEAAAETSYSLVTVRSIRGAKEIEKIERVELSRILVPVIPIAAAASRLLGRSFSINVDDRWSQIRGDLRKRVG